MKGKIMIESIKEITLRLTRSSHASTVRMARRILPAIENAPQKACSLIDTLIWQCLDKLLVYSDKSVVYLFLIISAVVGGMYVFMRLVYSGLNILFSWWGVWVPLLYLGFVAATLWGLRWVLLRVLRWTVKSIAPDTL